MGLKVSEPVQPAEKPSMAAWFKEFRVSSNYVKKHEGFQNNSFDTKKFERNLRDKKNNN